MSDKLEKARAFETRYGPFISEEERPAFHLTPTIGWMNDPNGFSYYQGEYHLFYQYYPYATEWGPMHWGHVKTKDFLHWERLPAVMAPDKPYDEGGCFSGSAAVLPDGRHLLAYTGVQEHLTADGRKKQTQTQCLAIGDGVNYEKWHLNPVLTGADLPEGSSPADFRDPKIWQEADGTYRMIVGTRTKDKGGAVVIYRSEDGLDWSLVGPLDHSYSQYGEMWECPDFFPLDGKQALLVSPVEMCPIGLEFHAGHGTVCILGSYDKEKNQFVREHIQAIDYGIEFYAPQTIQTQDGRRIMIGWLANWNTLAGKPRDCRWYGQMAIPRELSVKNGRLLQNPIREIEQYRCNKVSYQDVLICGETNLHGVTGRMIDMTLNIRPVDGNTYEFFRVSLAKDGEYVTTLRYKPGVSVLKIDRTRSGSNADMVHTRSFMVRPRNGVLKLRILMDRFSIEVFANDGEQAASVAIFTRQEANAISFDAVGSVLLDVEKYDINFT